MVDQDLFSANYTEGNLAEIKFITDIVGRLAVIAISVVGFGIVISTILKNALHGLYAVSPKFWDRVDEAKKASLGLSSAGGGNQISKVMGSITIVLLNCCPNVKALTDFDDEVLDAKAYFMKSIPMMCVSVFVGVFIFFGYPTKVAGKFSEFGTGVFDVVMLNIDPLAWVEALPTEMVSADLSTEGSKNDFDKAVNKTAKSVYNTYVGELSDMTSEKRVSVSREIEQWIIEQFESNGVASYCDTDKYKLTVTSRVVIAEPDVARVHNKEGKNGEHTFAVYSTLDHFGHGLTDSSADGKYIRFDLLFTPVASRGDSSSIDCTMSVPNNKFIKSGKSIEISIDENGDGASLQAVNGAKGEVDGVPVTIKVSGTKVTIKAKDGKTDISKGKSVTTVSGLKYVKGTNGHNIKEIKTGTSGVVFTPIKGDSNYSSWTFGASPAKKTDNTSSESSNQNKSNTNSGKSSNEGGW